jgi:hypothetical protein
MKNGCFTAGPSFVNIKKFSVEPATPALAFLGKRWGNLLAGFLLEAGSD